MVELFEVRTPEIGITYSANDLGSMGLLKVRWNGLDTYSREFIDADNGTSIFTEHVPGRKFTQNNKAERVVAVIDISSQKGIHARNAYLRGKGVCFDHSGVSNMQFDRRLGVVN